MSRYLCLEVQENVYRLYKSYDTEHTQSSEVLHFCHKSIDKTWHWMLHEHIHMHGFLCLQSYIKHCSMKEEVWDDIPEMFSTLDSQSHHL